VINFTADKEETVEMLQRIEPHAFLCEKR
jgi:hypothetical protein